MTAPSERLIGRGHAAGVLRAQVERATASHGGLVLVTGEAGIGKTTLVADAAEEARRRGALVLGGSCWDSDNAPGYWPWVQVLRSLRRTLGPAPWDDLVRPTGPGLDGLLGTGGTGDSGGAARGEAAASTSAGPDAFEVFDAVTTVLVSVSQERPVVVVLDDLHWADSATLRLLEFAAQHAWFERLLLVGTYRDVEAESPGHPLRPLILPLVAKATTVTLTGLARDEVGALMERTAGRVPDRALVGEVHRRTGGNPFFVEQTARLWTGGGDASAVPPSVREAVRRRLSLLPDAVAELLTTASVLGRAFDRKLLAGVQGAPDPHVDRLLEQAVAARLVASSGGGRFEFAHDLVRETLYDALDEADARKRHAAVVAAVTAAPGLAGRSVPADLARHAYSAGPELDPGRALDLLVEAAKDAEGRFAFEEAEGHYQRADEAAGRLGDARRRALVRLSLVAILRHNRDERAWDYFESVATAARTNGDAELLARCAITLYRHWGTPGGGLDALDMLREAHTALIGRGDPVAEGLAADRLARELAVRIAVSARRGADDEALAFSLWATHDTIWGPGTAAERLPLTDEMVAVGRRSGDIEMELHATSMRWVTLLELGDPSYLDQFRTFAARAEQVGQPRFLMAMAIDASLLAALGGRFAEAERHYEQAMAGFDDTDASPFRQIPLHMRWSRLITQGRYDEADAVIRAGGPDKSHMRLLAALTDAETGRSGDAARQLRAILDAADGEEPYNRVYAPLWLRFQALAAAGSGDPDLCEGARAAIAPYLDHWAVSLYGCDISGPMVLWSAVVDAAQERWDDAVDGFRRAARDADRMLARPWAVIARLRLAEALVRRGGPGDAEAAEAALAQAERDAAEMGMRQVPEWASRVRGVAAEAGAEGGAGASGSAAGPEAYRFRLDGPVWELVFDGVTAHMPDAKGLRDLHHLLGRPGAQVSAVHLLDPAGGDVVVAARGMGGDAVLDDEAKAQYRRRLAALDEEIDRAAGLGDDAKAAAFDAERAALLDELRAAAGLGGRARRLGDEAERARKTVTARIKDTLRRMESVHPALAAHLREHVTTGASCSYQAERGIAWRL
ncbi:ATP-binding protein [Yinghuangia sp. YIM S09857]|uniref:ATP-binding protein n=1 Tax=Yinghuangia sp. YIM S09857 TaxID=3436929 RepID=UPI003F53A7BB